MLRAVLLIAMLGLFFNGSAVSAGLGSTTILTPVKKLPKNPLVKKPAVSKITGASSISRKSQEKQQSSAKKPAAKTLMKNNIISKPTQTTIIKVQPLKRNNAHLKPKKSTKKTTVATQKKIIKKPSTTTLQGLSLETSTDNGKKRILPGAPSLLRVPRIIQPAALKSRNTPSVGFGGKTATNGLSGRLSKSAPSAIAFGANNQQSGGGLLERSQPASFTTIGNTNQQTGLTNRLFSGIGGQSNQSSAGAIQTQGQSLINSVGNPQQGMSDPVSDAGGFGAAVREKILSEQRSRAAALGSSKSVSGGFGQSKIGFIDSRVAGTVGTTGSSSAGSRSPLPTPYPDVDSGSETRTKTTAVATKSEAKLDGNEPGTVHSVNNSTNTSGKLVAPSETVVKIVEGGEVDSSDTSSGSDSSDSSSASNETGGNESAGNEDGGGDDSTPNPDAVSPEGQRLVRQFLEDMDGDKSSLGPNGGRTNPGAGDSDRVQITVRNDAMNKVNNNDSNNGAVDWGEDGKPRDQPQQEPDSALGPGGGRIRPDP
jgi:hypothetical protein